MFLLCVEADDTTDQSYLAWKNASPPVAVPPGNKVTVSESLLNEIN